MGRNTKYPYFLKKVELNKTTDQNFYKILGHKSYVHVYLPYDNNVSISKYVSNIQSYTTDKDFGDKYVFISCTKDEYREALNQALKYFVDSDIISGELKSVLETSEEYKSKLEKISKICSM